MPLVAEIAPALPSDDLTLRCIDQQRLPSSPAPALSTPALIHRLLQGSSRRRTWPPSPPTPLPSPSSRTSRSNNDEDSPRQSRLLVTAQAPIGPITSLLLRGMSKCRDSVGLAYVSGAARVRGLYEGWSWCVAVVKRECRSRGGPDGGQAWATRNVAWDGLEAGRGGGRAHVLLIKLGSEQ